MDDDIVTRLRAYYHRVTYADCVEAADEIERLRAAGDALARSYETAFPALGIDWAGRQKSLRAWQEARRG